MVEVTHPQLVYFLINILEVYMLELSTILIVIIFLVYVPFGTLKNILFSKNNI